MLALLAGAGQNGCSRDKLVAYLWPDSDTQRARHRLSDSLYVLRQVLDKDPFVVVGENIWLNRETIWVDVVSFQEAIERDDPEAAVELYVGPFLDGFHLGGSQEFEDWLESERARLAGLQGKALQSLALHAEQAGDPVWAARWWKRLLAVDPYSSTVALSLMEALSAAGDPANAIRQARAHERLLRDDLGMEPPSELRALVRRLRNERVLAQRMCVAVLPFVNLSGEPESEYFSDGMTFDIINHLAKITDLKVISRTSIMRYKTTDKHLRQIGEELGVTTVVEGEVQRIGDRVRINAQLVDALTDEQLWAEQYDRELLDVFAIQSDVAQRVATALKARLTSVERERIERRPTGSFEAYKLYLKGRYFWDKRGWGLAKGLECFQQALEIDPDYAVAHTGVADCYTLMGHFGDLPPKVAFPKARAAALRALEIDDGLAEAHSTLGFVRCFFDWNPRNAEQDYRRAIEINPGYAPAHYFYAAALIALGRLEEAVTQAQLALEVDPLSVFVNAHLGWMLLGSRQFERARQQLTKALELEPSFALAHWLLGWAYTYESRFDESIPHFKKAVELSAETQWFLASLGWAYGASGRPEDARVVLSELRARQRKQYVRSFCFVLVHVGLGELDEALDRLERAYEERDTWMLMLKIDPVFDGLRSEPRFITLLEKVGVE
jgi:TolB-like protein/Tfp pilus assembly protein PilF